MRYSEIENSVIIRTKAVGPIYQPFIMAGLRYEKELTQQNFIDAGWFLEIRPTPSATQVLLNTFTIDAQNQLYTYDLRDKTAQELADEAQAQADAVELEAEDATNVLKKDVTFAQIEAYIDANITDPDINKVVKKMAKAILILNKKLNL